MLVEMTILGKNNKRGARVSIRWSLGNSSDVPENQEEFALARNETRFIQGS